MTERFKNYSSYVYFKKGLRCLRQHGVRYTWQKAKGRMQGRKEESIKTMKSAVKKYHYSIDDIKRIVSQKSITTVSFDLFDTLLVRPSMNPTDIFYLLQERVREEYNLDFVALRLHAEENMGTEDATIYDIWDWIRKKNRLPLGVTEALMNMEVELETQLLTVNEEMLSVLQYAKNAGKRIIITSDMYLGKSILAEILSAKGITNINEIYVSCDLHARKSTGEIYQLIADLEGVEDNSRIVHIGDNEHSDYAMALNVGITAVYYPSIWEDACGNGRPWDGILNTSTSQDPYTRLLMSYSIFYTYLVRGRKYDLDKCFANYGDIASLYLGSVLLAISFDLLNNQEIQKGYDRISFAARDGYLPKKIYDTLANKTKALPSHYFQASRQALSYTSYKDFFDYFDKYSWDDMNQPYRLDNYIKLIIVDKKLAAYIISDMTSEEQSIDLSERLLEARKVLLRYKRELNIYFEEQAKLARIYYSEQFPGNAETAKRYLVFDCGYSGSVSVGLMGVRQESNVKFDKYYVWETELNKKRDRENGTKTFCLSPSNSFGGTNLIFEELFSPLEGSCLGFVRRGEEVEYVQDDFHPDACMEQAMCDIQNICIDYAKQFRELFAPYMSGFVLTDRDALTKVGEVAFLNSPYMEISMLKVIRFTDSLNGGIPIELSKKVYDAYQIMGKYSTPFHCTQFANPNVYDLPRRSTRTALKVGIHQHIHYSFVLEEFICYLKDFPIPYDLFITTTQPQAIGAIRNMCTALLPNLNKLEVIETENRGRDVAPWLLNTRMSQSDYDLFCHLHSKASVEYDDGVGLRWRRYLLDNLISHDAVVDIVEMFANHADIGCVFPRPFETIQNIMINQGIPLIGEAGEEQIINGLLRRMNIDRLYSRDDLLCSFGTMLWYRPKALQPLFDVGLTMEDFPEEPIPVGGTLAHAIERMPGVICESQGYRAVIFNEDQPVEKGDVQPLLSPPLVTQFPVPPYFRSWRGHPFGWYIKKTIKAFLPYGILRVYQRIRYNF